ncbi:hypothetical protein HY641_03490 [Candidatus Woesearchaeota archaeon]|nr:hypothetical protein [Candidatus Woesearchaeota archaeon]
MDPDQIRNVPGEYKSLIERFCTNYRAARLFADNNDQRSANNAYLAMVDIYSKITQSDLAPLHKRIAHAALTETYDYVASLNQPIISHRTLRVMVSIAVILGIVMILITLKPGIVGLVTLEPSSTAPFWTQSSRIIEIHKTTTIDLDKYFANPSSKKMTYLATAGSRVETSLYDHFLTIIPSRRFFGRDSVTIVAADQENPASYVRVPLTIVVSPDLSTR